MSDYDHHKLDDVIHSRIRLAVVSLLVGVEEADFVFLKNRVNTTDGNLSVHLKKLKGAGYIAATKTAEKGKAISYYKITPKGRKAFRTYVQLLESFLKK